MVIYRFSDTTPLRQQQAEMIRALVYDDYKYFCLVAHRRFGKDYGCWALIWLAAMLKPGLYFYLLPTIEQSRRVIWTARGEDGLTLLDRIPDRFKLKVQNVHQEVKLSSGSVICVTGADNHRRLRGTSPIGVVFSETQDLKSMDSYDYIRPALTRNKGWVFFNGTPRAYNHLRDIYELGEANPKEWWTRNLTILDTTDTNGSPIITLDDIERERRSGMPEELIQQEYFGSWTAAIRGAYYSKELGLARVEERFGQFQPIPGVAVHTGWDIGFSDYTAIWFFQVFGNEIFVLHYYEAHQHQPAHYAQYLQTLAQRLRIRYGHHFLPHDGEHHRFGQMQTPLEQLHNMGVRATIVPRVKHKIQAIQAVRYMFQRFKFHEKECSLGLKRLTEYHPEFSEKLGVYSSEPRHDASSHGADAIASFVRGWMQAYEAEALTRQDGFAKLYG